MSYLLGTDGRNGMGGHGMESSDPGKGQEGKKWVITLKKTRNNIPKQLHEQNIATHYGTEGPEIEYR
jgi:hypothetical protein